MKILLWNVEWATQRSQRGKEISRIFREVSPDIACITEGYLPFWEEEGNVISSVEDYGYKITEGRRKVILVSSSEWEDVDNVGNTVLPSGRYCFGRTHGYNIHGVCIPWERAHVSTGKKDKKAWEDHQLYLDGMKPLIKDAKEKTIILGDYNQRIPRTRIPITVYEKLLDAFSTNLTISTTGMIEELNEQAIDHLAHTQDIQIKSIIPIAKTIGSLTLSDHFGLVIEI